ncbi:helix-turn-helix domain-containing protein [Legionella erythra]|nr:helix-turn-helix domain-containing protein [Legionella erythra]
MPTDILDNPGHLLLAQTLNGLIEREKKLTPASLARNLGIPTNKITRILNGDVTDPKASTLVQIANYFGITIEQLLGLEPISKQKSIGINNELRLPVFQLSEPQQKTPMEWYRWSEGTCEGNHFALLVDTDLYEPTFTKNSLAIINPHLRPVDRSYIVVKKKNDSSYYSIKKYVLEGSQVYLYPINPQLPVENYDDNLYTITGVILEVHQRLYSQK